MSIGFFNFSIGTSKYFEVKPEMFQAIIDYNFIHQSLSNKLKVKFDKVPENVNIIDFNPKYVEYIIEKR